MDLLYAFQDLLESGETVMKVDELLVDVEDLVLDEHDPFEAMEKIRTQLLFGFGATPTNIV